MSSHVRGAVVVKIDIEGYEALLAEQLAALALPAGSAMILELHPDGFNDMGSPRRVLAELARAPHLDVRSLDTRSLSALDPTQFHQLEIHWPA